MNTVSMIISRGFREARSNESLNQTRTGTIVCSGNTSTRSIYNTIITGDWHIAFVGNRTHLKIENIVSIIRTRPNHEVMEEDVQRAQLT